MELSNQKKLATHIFRLLKVTEIVIPIGRTNKGNLGIKFTQNSDDFEIYLDAVPLSTKDFLNDENNIELKKMLEKYLFEARSVVFERDALTKTVTDFTTQAMVKEVVDDVLKEPRKKGRPAKK